MELKKSTVDENGKGFTGEAQRSLHPHGLDQFDSASFSDGLALYQMLHESRLPYHGHMGKLENVLPELPYLPYCSDPAIPCRDLSAHCLICDTGDYLGYNCTYGEMTEYFCSTKPGVRCAVSEGRFVRTLIRLPDRGEGVGEVR